MVEEFIQLQLLSKSSSSAAAEATNALSPLCSPSVLAKNLKCIHTAFTLHSLCIHLSLILQLSSCCSAAELPAECSLPNEAKAIRMRGKHTHTHTLTHTLSHLHSMWVSYLRGEFAKLCVKFDRKSSGNKNFMRTSQDPAKQLQCRPWAAGCCVRGAVRETFSPLN